MFASGPILGAANPYLLNIAAATLAPVGGAPVSVRVVDGGTRIPAKFGGGQIGYYLGPGAGIVIPVKPLKPATRYRATVTMSAGGEVVTRTWSFNTKNA